MSQLQGESEKVKALYDTSIRESTLAITKRNGDIDTLTKQLNDHGSRWANSQKLIEDLRRSVAVL
jgi:hypothetical protein